VKKRKTKEQWDEDGKDFGDFINKGDEIDEELYDYFLCFEPPECHTYYGFLGGGFYTTNNDGEFLYDSFYISPNKERFFYRGLKTIKEFIKGGEKI